MLVLNRGGEKPVSGFPSFAEREKSAPVVELKASSFFAAWS